MAAPHTTTTTGYFVWYQCTLPSSGGKTRHVILSKQNGDYVRQLKKTLEVQLIFNQLNIKCIRLHVYKKYSLCNHADKMKSVHKINIALFLLLLIKTIQL